MFTFEFELTAMIAHLNNQYFDFARKSKNKKMHVLELGFLCSNFFKLYFYRFAWDLSSVQTSNAFGQKVSFPWQLHVCSGEILSIKCFLLQCILLLSYFCLKEINMIGWNGFWISKQLSKIYFVNTCIIHLKTPRL